MGTAKFVEDCPVDGCGYKTDKIAGKFACMEFILKHVTEKHKMNSLIPDGGYWIYCPMKSSCSKRFDSKSLIDVFKQFHEHVKSVHSAWIDPSMCRACSDRKVEKVKPTVKHSHFGFLSGRSSEKDSKNSTVSNVVPDTVPNTVHDPDDLVADNGIRLKDMDRATYKDYIFTKYNNEVRGSENIKLFEAQKLV